MSATLTIRLPATEKAEFKRLARKLGEDLSEFTRAAMRARAAARSTGTRRAWAKYAGCVAVNVPPPTNANIQAAMRRAASRGPQDRVEGHPDGRLLRKTAAQPRRGTIEQMRRGGRAKGSTAKWLKLTRNEITAEHRRSKNAQARDPIEVSAQRQQVRRDPEALLRRVAALARRCTVRLSLAEHRRLVKEGRA